MLRVNVITCMARGRGLARDLEVIERALAGVAEVRGVELTAEEAPAADVNVFCEVPIPKLYSYATRQFFVPNPEMWSGHWLSRLRYVDRILCKSVEAYELFKGMTRHMARLATYVGWASAELHDPAVPRERRFFHMGGAIDTFKGTEVLLEAWKPLDYPLTIAGTKRRVIHPAITVLPHLPRAEIVREMNRHAFHICPSMVEGWCHAAHEAAGVGAVLVATDAPPVSDHAAIRIPAAREHLDGRIDRHRVTPEAIRGAVEACRRLSASDLVKIGERGRGDLARENQLALKRLRDAFL